MPNFFTAHLKSVNEGYWQHMRHAFSFSFSLFRASLACFFHGVFPFLFVNSGSKAVKALHKDMITNRASLSNDRN
jgi:hypothetical protein